MRRKTQQPTVVIPTFELARVALADYLRLYPKLSTNDLWQYADIVAIEFTCHPRWSQHRRIELRQQLIADAKLRLASPRPY